MDTSSQSVTQPKVLVVGNGMVGHKFIDCLLDAKRCDHAIVTFSEEPRLAYDRVRLSSYFSGASVDDLMLTSEQYYRDRGVSFLLRDKVVEVNREGKYVITQSGRKERYDKLVLATGSFPFVPPIPGNDREHCLVYRTIEDLEAITASAQSSQVGVVVGGGLLGLEAANALKNLGLESHVVEFAPRLMAVQLDEGGGALLRRKIESLGVGVHTEKATTEIVAGDERRYRMNFADGSFLETDMIVFSAGIRPQDALARQFGLEIGERGGIVVNNYCQTSDENIYAIGECALWSGRIFGLVSPGYTMAKVAACHIAGDCEEFVGADMSTKLKLLGVDVASIGDAHGRTEGSLSYSYYDEAEQIYKSVVVSADGKKLLGAVLVGDVADYGAWLQMMLNDLDIPSCPEELLLPKEDVVFDVESLPEEALICACNSVTKGQIESAVDAGARDMEAIKNQTLASTGCGSCGALAEQVFEAKMASLGYEVGGPADAVSGVYLSGLSGASLSPEKLLQLGAITQEFNLTTQLACDNRLQLVGVEPEQLSALQRRLNAAGLI